MQKVAEVLKIDPLLVLTTSSGTYIESGNNSPGAILGKVNGSYTYQTTDEHQTQLFQKLIENVMEVNKQILKLLQSK